jgi:hypothetical protein
VKKASAQGRRNARSWLPRGGDEDDAVVESLGLAFDAVRRRAHLAGHKACLKIQLEMQKALREAGIGPEGQHVLPIISREMRVNLDVSWGDAKEMAKVLDYMRRLMVEAISAAERDRGRSWDGKVLSRSLDREDVVRAIDRVQMSIRCARPVEPVKKGA